jgi:hypothetical protein
LKFENENEAMCGLNGFHGLGLSIGTSRDENAESLLVIF